MEIAISYGIYSILYFNFVHFITARFIKVISRDSSISVERNSKTEFLVEGQRIEDRPA